ncbi:hypothetical protein MMC22_006899 [Lobaria immixta]|nr:hypothetical protein [Lobaria immixta]
MAWLSVVAVVDSLPQLTGILDQTLVENPDTGVASNPDPEQDAIARSDFRTSLPNLFGSPADVGDLTKAIAKSDFQTNPPSLSGSPTDSGDLTESTENFQMSFIQPNSPAALFSYNPPSSDTSSNSNAPSNWDVSSAIQPDLVGTSEPKDSYHLTFLSPEDKQTHTNEEEPEGQKFAQELFLPEGVSPKIGIPRGVLPPSGSDVTPPVPGPDRTNHDPNWDYTDVKHHYTVEDEDEWKKPLDCTKLKGNNPRIAMCCSQGAPGTSGKGPPKLDPKKSTRRGKCILYFAVIVEIGTQAYDCYNPYFEDHEYAPNPNPPAAPVAGPALRDMNFQALTELGNIMFGISPLPGRELWQGRPPGPQGSNRGHYGGSQAKPGACTDAYLEFINVVPKKDPPKIPFVRT